MKKTVRSMAGVLALLMLASTCLFACKNEEPKGVKSFNFVVVNEAGETTEMVITGKANTVGEALIAADLISGENGAYGLYVLSVSGEYHKWEDDGKYWAFYINGEMAMTGVDSTPIEEGATYTFKVE